MRPPGQRRLQGLEMGFDEDTALAVGAPGVFDLDVPAHWRVARGAVNGGYVAAVVTRALEAVVADPDRRPRSLTVHYLAGCRPGPARITATVERSGSSMTALSARMTQGDATVALALAAFATARPGLDFQHQPMPETPPPEELPAWKLEEGMYRRPSFSTNWDYRPCIGAVPFSRAAEAISGGWLRLLQPRLLDAPLLAAMADAWIPPVITMYEPGGMLPTIDLTVHFRSSVPLPGAEPDDFSLAVFTSRIGAEGFWESDGVIWSRDGRVLAQARQLALFNMPSAVQS